MTSYLREEDFGENHYSMGGHNLCDHCGVVGIVVVECEFMCVQSLMVLVVKTTCI